MSGIEESKSQFMKKVLAIIVLFNPDTQVSQRIEKIRNQVSTLIIYDNSINEEVIVQNKNFGKLENVIYVSNGQNDGIGCALSYGAKYAQKNGYDYYATFDQDSLIPENYIQSMVEILQEDKSIGVIGPIYKDANVDRESRFPVKKGILTVRCTLSDKKEITDVLMIISSGSVYPIKIFDDVGYFIDELFIDYIDNEFCLRLLKFGYRVCVDPKIIISHALGNRTKKSLIISCSPTNYPFYRKYYITRNRLFVYKKYIFQFPSFVLYDLVAFMWDFIRVVLFESDKLQKLKAYGKGIKDFILGNYGVMK